MSVVDSSSSSSKPQYDWSHLYENARAFDETPVVLPAVTVVKGFQRGSKELGCPTANLSMDELGAVGEGLETGIYYGIATLSGKVR
jgi:FAD synthase